MSSSMQRERHNGRCSQVSVNSDASAVDIAVLWEWAKMILTASDVSDLSNALSWWERGEYFFSFVVAAACFGEYVADFRPQWYRTGDAKRDEKRKESISKRSTLVLVAALVFELLCLVKSNALAEKVIGSINGLATNAAGQQRRH